MSWPGIEPGPPEREASTLEKSHLDSFFAGYSEPLLGLRLALQQQQPGLYKVIYSVDASVWKVKISPVHKIVLRGICRNLQPYKILVNT
jgi:hypothetical protein